MNGMKQDALGGRAVINTGRILLPALLLVLAFSGCAPKRVIRGQTQSKPAKTVEKQSLPAAEMPPPEAHGKAENKQIQDPVQELQLGIKAASLARSQLDKPYQWGGQGPEKFDCSGLVFYIFGSLDVSMPRVSREQAKFGTKVKKSELQPGDLVFFITSGKDINHVGIYVGGSRFIHAPRQYSPVRYDSLNNSWWRQRFQFGRRISG